MDRVEQSLKGRTTYRDFTARWIGDEKGEIPPRFLKRIDEREAEIASKMQHGDELWEFEYGSNALAMTWGLAIVRDGKVVESWVEWKS